MYVERGFTEDSARELENVVYAMTMGVDRWMDVEGGWMDGMKVDGDERDEEGGKWNDKGLMGETCTCSAWLVGPGGNWASVVNRG